MRLQAAIVLRHSQRGDTKRVGGGIGCPYANQGRGCSHRADHNRQSDPNHRPANSEVQITESLCYCAVRLSHRNPGHIPPDRKSTPYSVFPQSSMVHMHALDTTMPVMLRNECMIWVVFVIVTDGVVETVGVCLVSLSGTMYATVVRGVVYIHELTKMMDRTMLPSTQRTSNLPSLSVMSNFIFDTASFSFLSDAREGAYYITPSFFCVRLSDSFNIKKAGHGVCVEPNRAHGMVELHRLLRRGHRSNNRMNRCWLQNACPEHGLRRHRDPVVVRTRHLRPPWMSPVGFTSAKCSSSSSHVLMRRVCI